MAEQRRSDHSIHLQELADDELALANRQLADAGRTIEELRGDVLALARRVDEARMESEAFLASSEAYLARIKDAEEAADEVDRLRAIVAQQKEHIARLKLQLQSPGKLVVKKALRRGQFRPNAS